MTKYSVYLEIDTDGRCMAHVLDLPGCIARSVNCEKALLQLPDAIRKYHTWLHGHGEITLSYEEPIEVYVAEESGGFGPFDPGDAAALFSPDLKPLARDEMESLFRLMAYSRADLLEIVNDLAVEVLNWKPDQESFSICRLLRHVGNAEEWYVSRVVSPESLPTQWGNDEALPLFEFLEMERQTAVACLRLLPDQALSNVFYPVQWTRHPEEPWTVRKVLRRFLEHEREHTAQVQEILAAYQVNFRAQSLKQK